MKLCLLFAVVACLISITFGSTAVGFFGDPKHPGKCVIRKNLILSPGEHKDPDTCAKIVCSIDGMGAIHSCGREEVGKGCKALGFVNKDLPYPECCKRKVVCAKH